MIWTEVKDPERACFIESDCIRGIHYEILYAQEYINQKPRGYVLYRIRDDYTQGCIGEINGKVGIVQGAGQACALGFHPLVIKQSIEELKNLAVRDLLCMHFMERTV